MNRELNRERSHLLTYQVAVDVDSSYRMYKRGDTAYHGKRYFCLCTTTTRRQLIRLFILAATVLKVIKNLGDEKKVPLVSKT
jgi:hypothetical protein